MSLAPFDKEKFQLELRDNIERILAEDQAVSIGQLVDFLEYFQAQRQSQDDLTANLKDRSFTVALRAVMLYATLAMSLQEQSAFGAALEVFPLNAIPSQWAGMTLEVLDHIRDTPPNEYSEFFTSGQPVEQVAQRIGDLRSVLSGRFAETL